MIKFSTLTRRNNQYNIDRVNRSGSNIIYFLFESTDSLLIIMHVNPNKSAKFTEKSEKKKQHRRIYSQNNVEIGRKNKHSCL